MTKLKICGLMNERDTRLCMTLGVDILGFVVEYPRPVPWNLGRDAARHLVALVRQPAASCVVTGGDAAHIVALARDLAPNFVQLHGGEDLETTCAVADALRGLGISVIKTLPDKAEERVLQFGTDDVTHCARLAAEAGVAILLVDSRTQHNAAQGGGAFDAKTFVTAKQAAVLPVALGGGITPDIAPDVVERLAPYVLDVMTGAELAPGHKESWRIEALVDAVRRSG